MTALFISMLLFLAQIPLRPAEGGTVTGVLKGVDGKPAAGVRVAAVTLPEIREADAAPTPAVPAAMSSIAETDPEGRYTLESIPQGRYYIAAGRVDQQTYYPGTRDMSAATVVSVMPGTTVSEINFTLNEASAGRAGLFSPIAVLQGPLMTVPLNVRAENGGRVPVFFAGKFPELRLTGTPIPISVPLISASVDVYGPTTDYRTTVANLPDGYTIQSVTYGARDITKGTLKLSASDFAAGTMVSIAPIFSSGLTAGLITQQPTAFNTLTMTGPPPPTLTITLRATPSVARSSDGVRVSGRVPAGERRSIYLSGTPGTIYSDGTFEFSGVRPGLHMIASLDNLGLLGAMVAVGQQDIDKVELNPTRQFPANMRLPREPDPLGSIAPGTVVPLAAIRGRVLEETRKTPVPEGLIRVKGNGSIVEYAVYAVGSEGRFEMFLLPGTYTLDFQIFGHSNLHQTVTVGTENITLDLTSRRLY